MQAETERLVRSLFHQYAAAYAARDERILEHFSEDFSGFSVGDASITGNLGDWAGFIRREFAHDIAPIHIEIQDLVVQQISDDVVILTAVARFDYPADGSTPPGRTVRHVQVRRWEGGHWRIVHSSTSGPDAPEKSAPEAEGSLEALVAERTRALADAREELDRLNETDPLTGVGNRRRFDAALAREWPRARRARTPLALIMMDIDLFKNFIDRYGQAAGDDCLKAIAATLARAAERRAGDVLARHGGEAFVVLLPGADDHGALKIARHLQEQVRALALPHQDSPLGHVTLSMGVASLIPSRDATPDDLAVLADTALYQARRAGRDRVMVAEV